MAYVWMNLRTHCSWESKFCFFVLNGAFARHTFLSDVGYWKGAVWPWSRLIWCRVVAYVVQDKNRDLIVLRVVDDRGSASPESETTDKTQSDFPRTGFGQSAYVETKIRFC